ncbi:MAG TPA: serine hydrolase, partial [Glaciihabitans sp.]|nr:serine hydrolase [Glaciihabitans sp.]
GLTRTALLDLARAQRGPDDAPHMSVGSADELVWLLSALARGEVVDTLTSERVLGWMSLSTDLSLVSSAFGLDPLAHRQADHGMTLVNLTASSTGVRVEVGALRGNASSVAFAVIVRFDDAEMADRQQVINAMRTVGYDILDHVS